LTTSRRRFLFATSVILLSVLVLSVRLPALAATETFATLAAKADSARDAEHLDEAAALYRQALALRPSWKDGWWSLGTIYYDQDAYAKAARAFEGLLKADPKNGTGYVMLGLCQFELKQDAASLKSIETGLSFGLIKDQSLRDVVLYHEGILLLRQGKFGSAQDTLSLLASYGQRGDQAALGLGMAALGIRPQNMPAEGSAESAIILRLGRAEALGARKQFDEGAKIYAQVVADAPEFPNIHFAYGRFLLLEHLTDEAIKELQVEIKNNPQQVQSYLEIASVQYHVDSPEGVKYAEQAVTMAPNLPFAHYLLGLLYTDINEFPKAITQLELAEKSNIHETDLYYALGRAYSRAGRKADAARARATFLRLSSAGGKEEPNIYGEHRPLSHDPASGFTHSNSEAKQP
jgi:tetratricopeptide (TPR) repeat protein